MTSPTSFQPPAMASLHRQSAAMKRPDMATSALLGRLARWRSCRGYATEQTEGDPKTGSLTLNRVASTWDATLCGAPGPSPGSLQQRS